MEEFFYRIFHNIPRQGPGYRSATEKALSGISDLLPASAEVLDVGCGSGAAAMFLAEFRADFKITAVDNDPGSLKILNRRISEADYGSRVKTVEASMRNLPFAEASLDLIWSEGAIYIMGFEDGLKNWKKFLKPEGFVVVSEVIWTTGNPLQGARDFWEAEYPAITDSEGNRKAIASAGYNLLDSFVLDNHEAWEESYYTPMEKAIRELRESEEYCEDAGIVCQMLESEIEVYRKYGSSYAYEFYIMQAV